MWIGRFLANRSQAVKVNGHLSNSGDVTSGVPQGSVLGPTLFLIYINDVVDAFTDNSVKYKLFADDIKLYSTSSSPHSSSLQTAIDRLVLWSEKWQLQLAPDKCLQASIKTSGSSTMPNKYSICSRPISFTDNIRDLGVLIDSKLAFKAHINKIIHQAFVRTRLILKCFCSRDKRILTRAYCTYVRPILEYCSPVWSPHNKQLITKIERVQRFFTRTIPGLRTLPYMIRLHKLGLKTLEHRRLIHDLCLCHKIIYNFTHCTIPKFPNFLLSRTRGHTLRLRQEKCSTTHRLHFFTSRVVKPWNSLPPDIISSTTHSRFKSCVSSADLRKFLTI